MTAIGFDFHVPGADGIDVRIDRHAAKDEISGAHDVHMERISGAISDFHRTRARDIDMRWSVDARGGNIAGAAKLLGVSRPTLYDLIREYGLAVEA